MLPLSHIALEPGDILAFDGHDGRFRVTQTVAGEALEVEAVRIDPAIKRWAVTPLVAPRAGGGRRTFGAPEVAAWDMPLLSDAEDSDRVLLAAYADPWPDRLAAYIVKGGLPETDVRAGLTRAAVMGRTHWDFYSGPRDRWDDGNRVEVEVFGPRGLESREALDVLNGANRLAIENPDGAWEIVAFRHAELTAPQRYRLSGFLRGMRGTEGAMRHPNPAGARLVLLDEAVATAPIAPEERGAVLTFRVGPASAPPSADTYRETQAVHRNLGKRPYAPAHLIAWRAGDGGVEIRWVRRARIGGDDWAAPDVPLGESVERYQIQLSKDGAPLRSYVVDRPVGRYAPEDQMADFSGGLAWGGVRIEVSQISEAYGAGASASLLIWL